MKSIELREERLATLKNKPRELPVNRGTAYATGMCRPVDFTEGLWVGLKRRNEKLNG